jgi:diguanylate cyclase (GGDEF)-like protein
MNVLVVDDQKSMRMLSAAVVGSLGHQVQEASCGDDAILACQQDNIDLVLLDVEMPGINGFTTAMKIREQAADWFPIIFVSAKTGSKFFVEGIRSGGDMYLFKPIVPEVLEAMIKAMERIALTQEKLHYAKLEMEQIAHRDALTGLVNRRGFDKAMMLELNKAIKEKSPLTLILIDIDQFKPFNDHYGHPAGDACLVEGGKLLHGAMYREWDVAARYGGEEFAIILPNTGGPDAAIVAKRVIEAFATRDYPHEFSDAASYVTVSGGLVILDQQKTPAELLAVADARLYKAKQQGRNRIVGD